ncbi:hypothetical protein H4R18_004002 [Coemansia javaensis]|uniref:Uncharacterized protein n=1 Tax=Coemansia javaensis TaxID=2761396 RepID=A0A9W8H655_9FUNG|nr:hypothetical protein H4R18_004002 [Coemansia javaensis]
MITALLLLSVAHICEWAAVLAQALFEHPAFDLLCTTLSNNVFEPLSCGILATLAIIKAHALAIIDMVWTPTPTPTLPLVQPDAGNSIVPTCLIVLIILVLAYAAAKACIASLARRCSTRPAKMPAKPTAQPKPNARAKSSAGPKRRRQAIPMGKLLPMETPLPATGANVKIAVSAKRSLALLPPLSCYDDARFAAPKAAPEAAASSVHSRSSTPTLAPSSPVICPDELKAAAAVVPVALAAC